MVEAERVGEKLAELMGRLGVHFSRVEPFAQAGKYVRGLLSDLPRKNCWTLAEHAGDATRTGRGVRTGLEFKTKPQLGADLLTDALDAGVRVHWCTADAVYGR